MAEGRANTTALLVEDDIFAAVLAALEDDDVVPAVGVDDAPPQAVTTTPATARPARLSNFRRVRVKGPRGSSMLVFSSLTTGDPGDQR